MWDTKKMLKNIIARFKKIYKRLFIHRSYIFSFIHQKRFSTNKKLHSTSGVTHFILVFLQLYFL